MKFEYSEKGYGLTKSMEGCKLVAYKCPAGVWTIGYGHTGHDVFEGLVIAEGHAEKLLQQDVRKFEDAVNRLVKVEITQDQFDALVDFAFNVGSGALEKSTLLKKLNAGDYIGAAGEFDKWIFADGKVLSGLVKRRGFEKALFILGLNHAV